jgi:stringent starvation protein B
MLSNRPYLLRAFHEWIVDSRCTPILVLNTHHPRCRIPQEYVEGDEIVFNISSTAVRELKLTNEAVEFKASFGGIIHIIYAPVQAVLAVYAEENGEGLFFDADEEMGEDQPMMQPVKLTGIDGMRQAAMTDTVADDVSAQSAVAPRPKPFLTLVE